MADNHLVIMAGGIGSRFWPMSTPAYPKQFIDIMGCGKTLIQLTADRFNGICPMENRWVVTSQKYTSIVKEQLPEIPEQNILSEPEARNTAPCIAYACWKIKQRHPEANIVVAPSDAFVLDVEEFRRCIKVALDFTQTGTAIVTLGMKPNRPETGYGYICSGEKLPDQEIHQVESFREKPDLETAKKYLAAGNYLWNAGIFVWNVHTITAAIRQYAPQIAGVMDELSPSLYTDREAEELKRLFPTCDKISIDYAVIEKASNIYVLPAEFGWSDLGTWGSLHTHLQQDTDGNAQVGQDVKFFDCKNCVVHTSEERKVVLQGLDGYIVAEKDGYLLICRLEEEQRIKEFSQD
ncbi:mannose-1-phosphate guanylyltransferase [Phocaeicola barnesiae]|uniref:mannose-1-phosphate guanylyltransferase n=1 Tax=Phocaeicola barnesiae TaxID=376804 RepID=UPI0025A4AE04|nr:mannose-1-phosphate guanylyltransferase [Phocaeicola barnesiae]MDM8240710.1 mannose-1-phosphate guanylyltransferase [Phocaeicola barnesiae]MDM8250754.1 mannose-1-phosphate guanylyltransferase [Phocaeicola barnesiae]